MNVPHLTVYLDPILGYVVDDDLPDNEDGTRNPGANGVRFENPDSAGEWVSHRLRQWERAHDADEAMKGAEARAAHSRAALKAYGERQDSFDDAAAAEEGRLIRATWEKDNDDV